jgi:uncharacterized protein (DUF1015 family)
MATVKPFAALRPRPDLAARICELPYDVVSSQEAQALAAGNPLSFYHVSKPEIDLPPATDPYDPQVYAHGRRHFERLLAEGDLWMEHRPCFYLYRQIMGRHSQTGLVAVVSCEDYLQGVVRKHELTRPEKEEDRLRHIEALDSQTGPVFLVYPAVRAIDAMVEAACAQEPDVDFTASDQVQHTAWTIRDAGTIGALEAEFARLPRLYIADGHHRCAAAARVGQKRQGTGQSGHFLAVIFPHDQVQILPYHRVVKDPPGLPVDQLWKKLAEVFDVTVSGQALPSAKHEVCAFAGGPWHTLRFRPELTGSVNPLEALDVALLQKHVLGPVFGIDDPRTSRQIDFVGGIRGTTELERLVRNGQFACAFSLFPTSIEDLMKVADEGAIMPPKSTWFEPKLRDAMFCHMI